MVDMVFVWFVCIVELVWGLFLGVWIVLYFYLRYILFCYFNNVYPSRVGTHPSNHETVSDFRNLDVRP